MKEPAELADHRKLPDDLKVLLNNHKVPENDPLIALLAWHWTRMNESRDVIQECTVKLTAALDERKGAIEEKAREISALFKVRQDQMEEGNEILRTLLGHMDGINKALSDKPLAISEQITKDLAHPIGQSVALVKQLATDTAGLLGDVEKSRKRLTRSHVITAFLSGYATAALILSWTFSHFFLH